MKARILATLAASLGLAAVVHAQQVLSYATSASLVTNGGTTTVQLQRFDSGLGTLTQVKLTLAGEFLQSVFAENKSAASSSYDLTSTTSLTLARSGGANLLSLGPVLLHQAGGLAAWDGHTDFAGTSGVNFSQDFITSDVYLDASLAGYIGTGSVSFDLASAGSSMLNTGANFAKGQSSSTDAGLLLEYTYSPIPEPASYAAILGVAAMGLVTMRRRLASPAG